MWRGPGPIKEFFCWGRVGWEKVFCSRPWKNYGNSRKYRACLNSWNHIHGAFQTPINTLTASSLISFFSWSNPAETFPSTTSAPCSPTLFPLSVPLPHLNLHLHLHFHFISLSLLQLSSAFLEDAYQHHLFTTSKQQNSGGTALLFYRIHIHMSFTESNILSRQSLFIWLLFKE